MLLVTAILFAASTTAQPARDMPIIDPATAPAQCPETAMSRARKMGKNPQAVPLAKLPPAQSFMAVDRRIAGCPAPLTMSDYQRVRR